MNNSKTPDIICEYFKKLTKEGKRVYGMITSKTLGFHLTEYLKKEGIKVIFYHGSDAKT
jgi:hypothetical protein